MDIPVLAAQTLAAEPTEAERKKHEAEVKRAREQWAMDEARWRQLQQMQGMNTRTHARMHTYMRTYLQSHTCIHTCVGMHCKDATWNGCRRMPRPPKSRWLGGAGPAQQTAA
eukprot:scaffold150137_cov18-Tisochrysis_lutea.AAC.2